MKNAVLTDDWTTVAITMTLVAQNLPKCRFPPVTGWAGLGWECIANEIGNMKEKGFILPGELVILYSLQVLFQTQGLSRELTDGKHLVLKQPLAV
jgi:hypothetical protein